MLCATILAVITSCESNTSKDLENKENKSIKTELSREDQIARAVESKLNINAAEKYDIQIVEEYINRDTLKDALILVNRKDWAHKRAKQQGNESFMNKTGFVGPFNHVFVQLGGEKDLLSSPPVGSSANHPLEHHFLQLTSLAQNDFYVDYRVRNSMYRNYYTVRDKQLYLTFNCPVYDSIGSPEPRAYAIKHEESSVRIAKDISMYEGKIVGYDHTTIEDPNSYEVGQIIPLPELYVYFIFDEKTMKYKTPMVPNPPN